MKSPSSYRNDVIKIMLPTRDVAAQIRGVRGAPFANPHSSLVMQVNSELNQ